METTTAKKTTRTTTKKTTTTTKKAAKKTLSATEREELIRQRAYFKAEHRGFACGSQDNDWLEAEKEINSLYN